MSSAPQSPPDGIELYWIPLGAGTGGACVRFSGWVFEAMSAAQRHRQRCSLFHSALKVFRDGQQFAIEMAPEWSGGTGDHGAVAHGPVGSPVLGRSRYFRYEVRCWRDGIIPDLAAASTPLVVTTDAGRTQSLLELTAAFPTHTWGRDEGRFGEMWNSNSLISWLLASSGHDLTALACPAGGRAPGWSAGVAAARGARSAGPEV